MIKRPTTWLVVALALAFARPAEARNYQNYPIGERAAGIGGAYIGIADDASGAYHNPAGLALAGYNQFSLTGTVYGYSRTRYENVAIFGADGTSGSLETFYANPNFFGTVYRLDRADDAAPTFAFSIVTPDFSVTHSQLDLEGGVVTAASDERVQTYWFGPSYARRLSKTAALGATAYGLFGQEQYDSQWSGKIGPDELDVLDDRIRLMGFSSEDRQTLGVLACVGLLAHWKDARLGLVARSPSAQVWGKGRYLFESLSTYQGQTFDDDANTKFAPRRVEPAMLGAGASYALGPVVLAADAKYHTAASYDDADKSSVKQKIELRPVVNVNLGAEWSVNRTVALRGGFYTNESALRADPANDTPAIDMNGLTAGVGILHKQTTLNASINYNWGSGETFVDSLSVENGDIVTTSRRIDITVEATNIVLSTTYRFGAR
ncbi:MAG: hypothetical protein IT350_09275 [Deltaproteobacteria bacterium]|nr:hypothetical protein [Deltaproteobacteria bacterium]